PLRANPTAPGTPSLTICWMAAWNADGAGAPARTPAPAGAAAVISTDSTVTMAADPATTRARPPSLTGRPADRLDWAGGDCGEHRSASRIMSHLFCLPSLLRHGARCWSLRGGRNGGTLAAVLR